MNKIKVTQKSLEKLKNIANNIEIGTFHFHNHILCDIRNQIEKEEATYVEIGTYAGCSSALMASHEKKTACYAIDIGYPIGKDVVLRNVEKFRKPENSFVYIQGSSMDLAIVDDLKRRVDGIDILYIDGDHSRNAVILDFVNYSKKVNPGGYVIFDDYLDKEFSPEVRIAIDEMCAESYFIDYEIIGTIEYDFLSEFTDMNENACFIIRKKL